ncbi:hypothetical protein FA95DRAFT_1681948 [Auriscalpium vulgare]|uniref:Uncharacterized protein n=1 Tax=Auriscalpium vulgare TaxID=40419 RepID=A0ACB8RGZ3_9AGAM|nr:hypothetical protein FA95DRAFT_1681948 [Auriscalpium vulgare]
MHRMAPSSTKVGLPPAPRCVDTSTARSQSARMIVTQTTPRGRRHRIQGLLVRYLGGIASKLEPKNCAERLLMGMLELQLACSPICVPFDLGGTPQCCLQPLAASTCSSCSYPKSVKPTSDRDRGLTCGDASIAYLLPSWRRALLVCIVFTTL